MGALTVREEVHARELTLSLLERLFPSNQFKGIGFRLWDGTRYPSESPSPTTTIVLNHPGALRAMLLPGTEVGLVEAYLYNDFDIEGNIEAVFPLGEALAERTNGWQKKLDIARELMRLPNQQNPRISKRGAARLSGKPHSLERDRQAVRYHYDVSNDFYSLFLGKRMVYSCAYFESPDEDLDTAQERKLDYICRKLRLKPGQKLLDLGCGWGGLVIYAAERYGVDVTGITLSEPQASLAQQRIAEAGLQAHARVR
ncbi:class I SAM-dependent methyltransferase, partial [Anaerolinea sp.]|uniref:class I SAM-dependent methyltransferase n=1 Tax=Anaerolinea sp. TaxID=1872519 RepID=UPI002ACDD98A